MHLSATEKKILHHLAQGRNNRTILSLENQERAASEGKGKFAHRPMSLFTLHNIRHRIHRKTGLDLRDTASLLQWERAQQFSPLQKEQGPTEMQVAILRRIAAGQRYPQICKEMVLTPQAAFNLTSQARKRANLPNNLPSTVRAYLVKLDGKLSTSPSPFLNGDPCF